MNRKLKISLYLAAIFGAGVFTGVLISYQVVRHMMPNRERIAARWCGELQSKLALETGQMEKIRPLADQALEGFNQDMFQLIMTRVSDCYERVAPELTPAQKEKLAKLQKEQESFLRARMGIEPPKTQARP